MPDDKALELLTSVYEAGCRHFDTAEIYAAGDKHNEAILGKFFQTVPRDSFSVATKYWPQGDNAYEYDVVKKSITASLARLQLDYVDLYYAHRVLSLEGGLKFAATAKRLQEEGLIKEVGLSEVSGKWLKEIYTKGGCRIDAVQQEWSLLTRSLEEELVPVCKELDITIVAYSPLSRNLLAKKMEAPPADWRSTQPRFLKENMDANQKIFEKVQELGSKYNCSAAQLSLAWLFHKAHELGVTVIPIPGSTKVQNASNNLGAIKVDISDEDCGELELLADQVAGARGNEQYMSRSIETQE